MMSKLHSVLFCMITFIAFSLAANAQTNQYAFSYQGVLKDGVNAANGNYHFEFSLYDAQTLGTQVGSTIIIDTVIVSNGVFAVNLDFSNQFPGADRYLEIKVRPTSGGALTTLLPRVPLVSTPYAIRAANSGSADSLSCNLCITNAHIVSVAGSKLTGTVDIANGGTGSSTKNFVDLSTAQTVGGVKTLTGSSSSAELIVTNAQLGITNASPANLPPSGLRATATSNVDTNAGVVALTEGN